VALQAGMGYAISAFDWSAKARHMEVGMKNFKRPGKYPFMLLLIFSTIILTVMGYMGKNNIYADYSVNLFKNPQLLVVFEGIKDGNYPWKAAKGNNLDENTKDGSKDNPEEKNATDETVSNKTEDAGKTKGKGGLNKEGNGNNSPVSGESDGSKNPKGTKESNDPKDSKPENKEVSYEFATVKESYFKDALFIGDSRTVGLEEYSGWKDPTYYAETGITIYEVFDKKIAEVGGQKVMLEEALKKKNFKKIYIMLGINEMGIGTAKSFTAEYKKVIDKIKKLQPDAIIFIQSIMNVTKKKSDTDPVFNNKKIKERNEHLALLADNKKVFYIDVNEAITDNTGGMAAKYTFDSIHLKAVYYKIWTDFLLKHGVVEK
jgi:hypothetical protein